MAINGKAEHVLIVEDEIVIAMYLEDLLDELGHHVSGIASRVDKALEIVRGEAIDFAVLDINVAGRKSFPVADVLRERDIPFIFATGYGSQGLDAGYEAEALVRKPFERNELAQVIDRVLNDGRSGES